MTSMRISEFAHRAGVPASTLRFYDKAGLLPAGRTASGYRVYDDEAVERLAFIRAVRLLGLSLGDVCSLLAVWTAGSCDSVRADLRPRLAERIADARSRQAELGALTAALSRVLRRLDTMPNRSARCDARCGYAEPSLRPPTPSAPTLTPSATTPTPAATTATPAATTPTPAARHAARAEPPCPVPVACSLDQGEVSGRLAEWHAALDGAGRRDIPGGFRLTVPAARAGSIAALAAAEQRCCPFFGFLLQFDGDVVHLDVRAPADAGGVLSALFP